MQNLAWNRWQKNEQTKKTYSKTNTSPFERMAGNNIKSDNLWIRTYNTTAVPSSSCRLCGFDVMPIKG